MTLYFEDFSVGRVFQLGTVDVTEHDIVEFASRFDPQPFHFDPAAARRTPFGGIIASGWHTCSMYMSLYATAVLQDVDSQGSPGVDEIRWLKPVRPGDWLTGTATVMEATPSARNPMRGAVRMKCELENQHGDVAMRMTAIGLFGRRPD
ncbi:MAG TPA: MaoC family dehydratase [Ilumatobacteraceae bacterium]|nr:MaoC family dehydratase [Ilumatobacteraceae bacterium]